MLNVTHMQLTGRWKSQMPGAHITLLLHSHQTLFLKQITFFSCSWMWYFAKCPNLRRQFSLSSAGHHFLLCKSLWKVFFPNYFIFCDVDINLKRCISWDSKKFLNLCVFFFISQFPHTMFHLFSHIRFSVLDVFPSYFFYFFFSFLFDYKYYIYTYI